MSQTVSLLMQELSQPSTKQSADVARDAWICSADPVEFDMLLDGLIGLAEQQKILNQPLLSQVLQWLVRRLREPSESRRSTSDESTADTQRITLLYKHLGESCACRWTLLQWLTVAAQTECLQAFHRLLPAASFPDENAVALVFSPLFQQRDYDPSDLFPDLLEALARPQLAPSILDLANFMVREGRMDTHPAADRREQLEDLLRSLMHRLQRLDETGGGQQTPEQISRTVADCVALVVSLCDALALIGHPDSVAVLGQVMELPHRRIRTEAAAALARLHDESGVQTLVELAREPIARLRVLAYAAELGLEDKLDSAFTSDEARCEAEVALQLAQPAYFGLPPTRMEMVDCREMYWPGCDEPLQCYLFRYYYELGASQLSNIAIGGPLVHTFAADLVDLPIDDIYAAFAGWDVEHDEISEVPADALTEMQQIEVSRLERRARDAGYDGVETICLGQFFGARYLIAQARRHSTNGMLAVDPHQILWYPHSGSRPLGPHELLCIYRGRQLLRSFPDNP